jgi:hypothetical protein
MRSEADGSSANVKRSYGPFLHYLISYKSSEAEPFLLRLSSYLASTRLAYASYLPYMYDRTVSTVYRTHFGLCRYLDT